MTTKAEALAIVKAKKYKPVDINQYGHGFLIWFETKAGITYATLGKRFEGSGFDVVNHGFDVERQLFYFVLVADSVYSSNKSNCSTN
jgi:hypothetical protein